MRLNKCRLIDLPKFDDLRGSLSPVEGGLHVPFDIKRVFYIHQVPAGADRAGHALKTCEQFMVAVSGAFEAVLDDGNAQSRIRLDSTHSGLYLPPLIWLKLENFRPATVCLVLASERYSDAAYLRSYEQFRAAAARPE
ncbi:MAG: WxcM-like domain-containing protein [Betaproteobacteria bacterium]|nr:WxcM-like domain-containing protein [Betaproteobacteria bacterium]